MLDVKIYYEWQQDEEYLIKYCKESGESFLIVNIPEIIKMAYEMGVEDGRKR